VTWTAILAKDHRPAALPPEVPVRLIGERRAPPLAGQGTRGAEVDVWDEAEEKIDRMQADGFFRPN